MARGVEVVSNADVGGVAFFDQHGMELIHDVLIRLYLRIHCCFECWGVSNYGMCDNGECFTCQLKTRYNVLDFYQGFFQIDYLDGEKVKR